MQSITRRLKRQITAMLLALNVCMTSLSFPISARAAEPTVSGGDVTNTVSDGDVTKTVSDENVTLYNVSNSILDSEKEYELKPVDLANLKSGSLYVLMYYTAFSDSPKGPGYYVISSEDAYELDGSGNVVGRLSDVRDYVAFSEKEFTDDMVWKIETCEDGYSLQSADSGKYLSMNTVDDVVGLYMSDTAQALTLTKGSNGTYITRNIDGTEYSVRYTGGSGTKPGWVAQEKTSTREFTLYEVAEVPEQEPDVEFGLEKLTPGTDGLLTLEAGERYVFVTDASGTAYALSSDKTAYTEKERRAYKAFDGIINTLTKDMVWYYGESGTNKYLRSAETGRFLNITADGTKMKWPTAFTMISDAEADGKVSFRKTISKVKYYLTFTSDNGQGFDTSSEESAAVQFDVYKVVGEWPEESAPQEFSFTWVHPDDMQIGDVYFFPFYKQMSSGIPTENGVQTLTSNEVVYNDTRYGRESKTFEYDLNTLDRTMAFVLEPGVDGEGYALRSLATGEYLNLSTNNLKLGEIQTLTLTTLSLQQVGIGNGTGNYVRFLASNPRGWTTGSGNNYEFDMYRVNGVWPEDRATETFGTKWMRLKDMKVGDTLVFSSYETIVSTDKGEGIFALSAFDGGSNSMDLMEHVTFTNTADTLTEDIAWVLEEGENGEGYALRSLYYDQYLNINVVNGQGGLSLGAKQTLQLTTDANNRIVISRNIDGTEYRVIFTNENGGGWQIGTTEEYSQFNAWRITGSWPVAPDEATQREEPLMTIAAVADFHIDFGRENQEQVLSDTNQTMLTRIKTEDAPDVLLVGGDMTGNTDGNGWSQDTFTKVESQLTEALQKAADKVLYVTGDTDYQAGGSVFSSGAFIDSSMQADVGAYKSALYEGADRASNLLAYYYEIEGVHFIGLNTPYNGDGSISGYVYTPESIEWVAQTLESIGTDETIIFMSHYMLQDSKGMTSGYGIDNTDGANDRLKEILLSYPNLLYVYGHDHGGDGAYISEAVFERVTAYETDGSIQLSDRIRAGSFTSSFMGSLSYYNNQYNSGDLSGEQPKVVQALLIYVYADRIELEMKNYGEGKGDRMYPFTYSIPLLKPVTSEVYTVTEEVVTDIAHGVTVGEFISNFTASDEIVVRDLQGTVITDMSRKVRNGMTVARISEGAVLDEKDICINLAADDGYPYKIECVNLTGEAGVVFDLAEAQELTSVVISKQKEDAAAGILYVGIYAEDGSLLQSETKQVSESGTVDVNMSLADCPAVATYRIFMVDFLDSMILLSALETSNEEYWQLDGLVAKDASTEMVACLGYVDKDTAKSSILVYDMNTADWNVESALVWQWRPSEENGFLGAEKYIGASDAKLRYSEFYGGYVVVTSSTKGFVGIVDYETGENLYSRPSSPENNTHAVELLPDGNMVAASTTGNTVTIYASSQGDGEGYYKQ
ncbi:MAG: metallophosphoesterase [Lachnospiraceae bacterium]|nr:metallophosphoesterase [Lachnospiraceae bacterium]